MPHRPGRPQGGGGPGAPVHLLSERLQRSLRGLGGDIAHGIRNNHLLESNGSS